MKAKTYVINLKSSITRREYMNQVLKDQENLDLEYIEAVYGRDLTEEEINNSFDRNKARYKYGRDLNLGEIGCALSHRRCYQKLLDSEDQFCLILEDDITIIRNSFNNKWEEIETMMSNNKPTILLLSGDYWYFRRTTFSKVFDATGSYAYFINRPAASIIMSRKRAEGTSDDWIHYKRHGIRFYAHYPYCIDANLNMDTLSSDVKQDSWDISRKNLSFIDKCKSYSTAIIKRFLKATGHFESKVRVYRGKPIQKIPSQ